MPSNIPTQKEIKKNLKRIKEKFGMRSRKSLIDYYRQSDNSYYKKWVKRLKYTETKNKNKSITKW